MKRLLRILLLGPVYLVAALVFTLVAPVAAFVLWLMDERVADVWEFIGWLWIESARSLWTNEMRA